MAWRELQPPSTTDRISISQHKRSGKITISLSGEAAKRNKISKGTALRISIDLESPVRKLRIEVAKDGPFKALGGIGASVKLTLAKLAELGNLGDKTYVEWDESKSGTIDIDLPDRWQVRREAAAAVSTVRAGSNGPALAPRRG